MTTLPNAGVDANLNGDLPFSASSAWNERVDTAPLVASSAAIIAQLAPSTGVHPDFGSAPTSGIPYVVVPANQPMVPFTLTEYPSEADPGPYPIPAGAPIEAGSDHHMIVVQQDPNSPNGIGKIYEAFNTSVDARGNYSGFGAVFDSTKGDLQRPIGNTSADAAGLPIFPGLLKYDEVQQAIAGDGVVHHAIRVTFDSTLLKNAFVSPAEHSAGNNPNGLIPFGTRLRLDPNYVIPPNTSPENRVIIQTMKTYGLIVADIGANWFITGSPDARWNDSTLHDLLQTTGKNFQVVDASHLTPGPNPGPGPTPNPSHAPVLHSVDTTAPNGKVSGVEQVTDNPDGTHTIQGNTGQRAVSAHIDTFQNDGHNMGFVFKEGAGQELVTDFKVSGRQHDYIILPFSQSANLAAIIQGATDSYDATTIHYGTDSVTLQGVTRADIQAHRHDFRFHG